ncbi:MAG: type II toxin-antitoxin system HicB family antitoxin [Candidatus Latescibacteria bacterium]|nr:type II toxin-antitoxin system HicB family antitoxin [Candidatus Latescibacterota bacterium]
MLTAEIYKKKKGLYVSHCPQIGIASQGKNEEEAFNNLKEAVSLYLEEVTTATA